MEDRLPRPHVFPYDSGDSGADLVKFEVLNDPGHTIKGLVVDPLSWGVYSAWISCTSSRMALLRRGWSLQP